MMRFVLILLVFLTGLAAPAQAADGDVWSRSGDRLTLDRARISFLVTADRLALTESKEFSRPGESLDAVAQYQSPDQKIFATVYVYYPGISHAGLAAFATDNAIRLNSNSEVTTIGTRIVAAGGAAGVALRTDYSGYRGNHASSAAFIKAGRWMVKLRVSGPEERRSEVAAAMTSLLDNIRFEGDSRPRPAAPLEMSTCPAGVVEDAGLVPAKAEDTFALALLVASFDPAGSRMRDAAGTRPDGVLTSRIGSAWCKHTMVQAGDAMIPILRAADTDAPSGALEGKSILFAPYSDAGGLLEVVRLKEGGRYLLLNHRIGVTNLLGTFDAVPSDAQIALVLAGQSPAGRVRARVAFKADGDTDIQVEAPPPAPPSPTT